MDDELEDLRHMFLDECSENIELLERGLMRMDEGHGDADTLNEVFRAAHSIKGGGATFGYTPMAELTHYMETLLDEMRSERRPVVPSDVDLLLQGLDIVQSILADSREQSNSSDNEGRIALQERLQASVDGNTEVQSQANTATATEVSDPSDPEAQVWCIDFKPKPVFYQRGNDPLRFLRELQLHGDCVITIDHGDVPVWDTFDVSKSYLSWHIEITSQSTLEDLTEVFEWVSTDCTLSIKAKKASSREPDKTSDMQDQHAGSPATIAASPVTAPVTASDYRQPSDTAASAKPGQGEHSQASKPPADKAATAKGSTEASSIRIATDKIDQLIDLVGELVITQSMLSRVTNSSDGIDINELHERMADLEHNTRDLQESVMQVRMLPISSAYSRLPRLVRDLSRKLNKQVDLVLDGGSTELDKTVLERMIDPLVHLVRNGLDHGLETVEQREAAGKPATGKLHLNARQESGSVVIEITDDGKGINGPYILAKSREKGIVGPNEELTPDQINQLIFAPGFSTAETISDVSGRGVGMDVVKRNILDLGGRVHVYSTLGQGTRVEINLPLSLAILDGQLVSVAGQTYIIPVLSIIETLELAQTERADVPGAGEICRFRGEYLRMLRISDHFNLPERGTGKLVVVIDTHGKRLGLVIDSVLGQQQVVIKPLDRNYKSVRGLAGATIMSDGSVALILDPANIEEPEQLPEAA